MFLLVLFKTDHSMCFRWHVAAPCMWFIEFCETRTHSKPVSWAHPPGSRNSSVAFRGRLWPIKGSRFQQPGPNEARRRGSSLFSCGMLGWKWRRGGGLQWEAASCMGQGHLIGSFQGHHGTVISSPVTCPAASSQWDFVEPDCLSVPPRPKPPLDEIKFVCVRVWLYLYVSFFFLYNLKAMSMENMLFRSYYSALLGDK